MKIRTIVIGLVVAGIAGTGVWWAYQPQPIGVDLATIGTGTLVVTVDDEGIAQIKDTYTISTPIGGTVERIPFIVGDHVERDQIVATIVPQLSGFLDERSLAAATAAVKAAEAAVASAQADINAAKSQLTYWEGEVARTERLLSRGLATQQSADQAQFQLTTAQSTLANAEANLELRKRQHEQAQAQLVEPDGSDPRTIKYELRAPVAAQVLEVSNESARNLPAGSQLLTIGDPRNLEIVVDLLSSDAVKIVAGSPATVDGWGGDKVLDASVRRVEPVGFTKISALGIEEQRVRVHLDIDSPSEDWTSLGHLYRVFVHIQTDRKDDAVLVPIAALFRTDDHWSLYADEDGVARLKTVAIGARNDTVAEVLDGVTAGTQVVLHPSDRIAEGGLLTDRAQMAQ